MSLDENRAKVLYEELVKYQAEAQTLDQHLQSMQEQLRALQETEEAIAELEKLSEPKETWVPIAPGAYVKAITKPLDGILITVGANIAVEKKPAEVMKTLADHHKVLEDLSGQAFEELKEVLGRMDAIKAEVEKSETLAAEITKHAQAQEESHEQDHEHSHDQSHEGHSHDHSHHDHSHHGHHH